MIQSKEYAVAMMALLAPFALLSATYYASPDGTGTGTADSPCSITAGINKVKQKAHTLILKPGRYLLTGAIAFNGTSSGTPTQVLGETGNPADVILDAQGQSEAMRINQNVLVAGVTIVNGSNASSSLETRAAGIRVGFSTNVGTLSVASNCVVMCCTNEFTASNKSSSGQVVYGGAVCVYDTGLLVDSLVTNNVAAYRSAGVVVCNGTVRGCKIAGNTAANGGGGVFCERSMRAFVADSMISGNAGSDDGGGGAACYFSGSVLTLTNCVISGNTATSGGGAYVVNGGTLNCLDCLFEGNEAGYGGGVDARTTTTFDCFACRFESNVVTHCGGGVLVRGTCHAEVRGCVFDGNRAAGAGNSCYGGGLGAAGHAAGASLMISNTVFRNNYSAMRGGGFGSTWGVESTSGIVYAHIVDSVFTNNSSQYQGGAVCVRDQGQDDLDTRFLMRNCLVAFNTSEHEGCGVYFVGYANPVLDSCTIVSNTVNASARGAGIYHRWGGTVTNCVIAFNMKGNAMETGSYWCLNGNNTADSSAYHNCCLWQGDALDSVFLAENGCINVDPLFVDAANGHFTPQPNSPCRNAGVVEDWMTGATDLAGSKRVSGRGVDIGCYELFVPSGLCISFR